MIVANGQIKYQTILFKVLLGFCGTAIAFPASAELPKLIDSNSQYSQNTASNLVAQGVTRVTGVQIDRTDEGLELVLETVAGSERLVPLILPQDNDLVIDILDATLAFSIRNGVTKTNPALGIDKITVNQADENSIRVIITGEDRAPSAEVVPGRDNTNSLNTSYT